MSAPRRRFDPLGQDTSAERDVREATPDALADLVARFVGRTGWGERLRGARVHERWEEIAGPELARHTEPIRLHGGVLVLRAASSAWATQVRYLSGELTARANAVLGAGQVARVTVVTAARAGRQR